MQIEELKNCFNKVTPTLFTYMHFTGMMYSKWLNFILTSSLSTDLEHLKQIFKIILWMYICIDTRFNSLKEMKTTQSDG